MAHHAPSTHATPTKPALPSGAGGTAKVGKPYKVGGHWYTPMPLHSSYDATGIASWYGRDFHGRRTANGEIYDMHALSAAHKTLPLPTLVRVTNLENGRSVIVRVNDRGPFVKNRLIDLSYAAAKQLGYADRGTTRVRVQTLDLPAPQTRQASHTNATPAAHGGTQIQVGAFASRDHAEALATQLKAWLKRVHIVASKTTPPLYKVRIGPFQQARDVEQQITILQQHGFDKPMVLAE